MYVIVRDSYDNEGLCMCNTTICNNLAKAHVLLEAYKIEWPNTKANPRIMELHPLALKPALAESVRITEVPDAQTQS